MVNENWHQIKLADICDSIDYGYTAAASTIPVGAKFLRITDIVKGYINWDEVPFCNIDERTKEKYQLYHRDIVIARTGAGTGVSTFIADPPDAIFASYLVRLKIGKRADARFISYFLKSPEFWDYIHGVLGDKSAQPNASAKTMTQVMLKLPPFSEQLAIARILNSLDEKIELNRQMNETLEAISRAIFKSWFVDFDPVRAKVEGRDPQGMNAETAYLFPDSFGDSVLGSIPKNWEVKSIGEVVKVVGGSTPSTKDSAYWEGGTIHWATPKDLSSLSSSVLLNTERCITDLGLQQIGSGLLPEGTVLLSSRAPIGYLAISKIPIAINQGFIAIICDEIMPNHYILYWLKENMGVIEGRANGTTFQEISKSNFRPISMLIPPIGILQRFNELVDSLHQQVVNNLEQSLTLSAIRDTLLPKLILGEVKINDIEKELHDYSSTKEEIKWKF